MPVNLNTILNFLATVVVCFGLTSASSATKDSTALPPNISLGDGRFIRYELVTDSTYKVVWGNKLFQRELPEAAIGAFSWFPILKSQNDRVLILEAGCGNPCWEGIMLPMDSTAKPVVVGQPMAYDLDNDLVAFYCGGEDTLMTVMNYLTHRSISVLGQSCATYFGYCIDSIALEKKVFWMRHYSDTTWIASERKGPVTTVELKIDF